MALSISETAPDAAAGLTVMVGPDPEAGHEPQALVPGRSWQSASPGGDTWSLVACVVAPGFDFEDFELLGH